MSALPTPREQLGGEAVVLALAQRFYDIMERDEKALAAVHHRDAVASSKNPAIASVFS